MSTTICVKRLTDTAKLPRRATNTAAGFDLFCDEDKVIIPPKEWVLVSTGIALQLPQGYEAQIRSRSGMAAQGVTVMNAPGTIDADYRGEIKVLLLNHRNEQLVFKHGNRIAQMVIQQLPDVVLTETDNVTDTERGAGGFGSTGV